jgi:4-hydroxythreonine-4-phosphate dehydrogenase
VPAAESEFARDKYSPVTKSSVREIIAEQSDACVYIHENRHVGNEYGIHVYDAETAEDLEIIAEGLEQRNAYTIMAGCSGFAGVVPELLGFSGNSSRKTEFIPGLIAVCGSTNKVTRDQIDYAGNHGFAHINMTPDQTLGQNWRSKAEADSFVQLCMEEFNTAGRLVIDTNDAQAGRTAQYADLHGLDADQIRNGISDTLGWLLREMLDRGTRATIMLTGGDTLLGFLRNIGTMQLIPVCELDTGVVLSYLNYAGVDYPVISKSGGFGRHDLIARLADKIGRSYTMNKPIIGITMGDPYGSGADISVKALADPGIYDRCRPLVVGDACCMEYAAEVAAKVSGINVRIHPVKSVSEALFEPGTIDVFDMGVMNDEDIPKSEVPQPFNIGSCAKGGEAAFQYVVKVIEMAMAREIDGTVTNALSKEAINMAGHHFSGHTEIYAHYTGTKKYTMMLAHNDFRVVHVSTHVSLREACDRVKKDRVLEVIRIANDACKSLGIAEPKIGVAGLNPHCGENGLFGTEEIEEIQPAIDQAMTEGIIIPEKKPTPPDTLFSKAIGGWYDIVVVMYHDQGHIPVKVKGFVYNREKKEWDAVAGINVTLGLPIIRASVDHGTDFVHAGSGTSNEISLVNAIDYAVRIANNA